MSRMPLGTYIEFDKVKIPLEGDFEAPVASQFRKLLDFSPPDWLKNLSLFISNNTPLQLGSLSYKQFGYQIWDSTEPIALNLSGVMYPSYYAGVDQTKSAPKNMWDALHYLMSSVLPREPDGNNGEFLTGLIPPGPAFNVVFGASESSTKVSELS